MTFVGAAVLAGAALWQARTARQRHEEQTKADLERRITESFAKAVEQLGSDKLETRLGAIYTLERLSRESEREYWPIMETLTAYVREHSPWPPRMFHPFMVEQEKEPELLGEPEPSGKRIRPATDIQAILTVLGRRDKAARKRDKAKGRRLDLSWTDLRGANLRNAHFEWVHLGGAHLEHADMYAAHLQHAHLGGACLKEASLWGAYLQGTSFIGAHLQGADLRSAYLNGADLERADLKRADLLKADFGRAYLLGAHLEEANIRDANLLYARILIQEQIDSAVGDESTILPERLKRPAHWPPEWPPSWTGR